MNEYFCPKCGAILNDQYGFDPDRGTWTCTECGELLMDDDIYCGDTFEGVAWYCDRCGVLLNRQDGFSDSYGSWTCTKCGHINGTTEDDIIGEGQPEFSCPNCGVALDFQPDFDKYDDDWECTACGAHLHHNYSSDQYSIVEEPKFRCPNCNAGLDNQRLFSTYSTEWECTECGAKLQRDYCWDEFNVVEEIENSCPQCGANLDEQLLYASYEEDWECTECGAHLHRDFCSDPYEIVEESDEDSVDDEVEGDDDYDYSSSSYTDAPFDNQQTDCSEHSNVSTSSSKRRKSGKIKNIGILLLILVAFAAAIYYEFRIMIPVGYSSVELVGRSYEEVISNLKDAGFTFVHEKSISDLTINQLSQEYIVTDVKIGFSGNFCKTSRYPSNFPVIITYHTLENYNTPMSSKEIKGANYIDVENSFKKAGFSNVKIVVDYDIIMGWLSDVGEVESVTINGNKRFSSGTAYRADSEIIITYHDLRKNKPN